MQQIIILFLLLLIVLILSVGIIYPLIFGRKNKNFTPSQAMKTVGILFVLIIILGTGSWFLLGIAGVFALSNAQFRNGLGNTLKQLIALSRTVPTVQEKIPSSSSSSSSSSSGSSSGGNDSFISSHLPMQFLSFLKKSFFVLIGLVIIWFILSTGLPWYTVPPGEVALITRLGKLRESYNTEGLHFKIPVIDKVIRINIQTQKVEATANAASKDLQNISATIAVNGNIQANSVKELYRNLGDASLVAEKIINPSIQESVKAATAKYTAEELITKRTLVSQEIKTSLVDKLGRWGILVSDVNIVNFQFSADFDAAIEKKVKAEQEALAEKNKLESVKFQAQQKVEQAKAEAESIRIQAEAIKSQGGAEYVNLKWIEKRDGKLPQTSLGGSNGLILNLKQ